MGKVDNLTIHTISTSVTTGPRKPKNFHIVKTELPEQVRRNLPQTLPSQNGPASGSEARPGGSIAGKKAIKELAFGNRQM